MQRGMQLLADIEYWPICHYHTIVCLITSSTRNISEKKSYNVFFFFFFICSMNQYRTPTKSCQFETLTEQGFKKQKASFFFFGNYQKANILYVVCWSINSSDTLTQFKVKIDVYHFSLCHILYRYNNYSIRFGIYVL